jgi:hypothetical protein
MMKKKVELMTNLFLQYEKEEEEMIENHVQIVLNLMMMDNYRKYLYLKNRLKKVNSYLNQKISESRKEHIAIQNCLHGDSNHSNDHISFKSI